jgi:hypothetical protein
MSQEEAVQLFLRAADVENAPSILLQEEARTIVNTIGCLALAIIQVGAYVQQGHCSIGEYYDIYSRRRDNHLSVQAGSSHGFSEYTTWEVSLDVIKSRSDRTSDFEARYSAISWTYDVSDYRFRRMLELSASY